MKGGVPGVRLMSSFVDTNIIVRYLMNDVPELADRAAEIIDGDPDLQIPGVVLAEAAYVLTSVYRVAREAVVDGLIALLQRPNVTPHALDKDIVIQGLLLCRPSGRVSFADALTWATARSAGATVIYSFDQRFPTEGLEVRRSL